jgi:hypothetical protein
MTYVALLSTDWALRGITIGLLLLIAAVLLRDYRASVSAKLAVAFAIGTTAYVICSGPASHPALGRGLVPLLALTAGNNVVFWLFAAALFDDTFRLRWWHGAIWLLMVVLGAVECMAGSRTFTIALTSSSFVFAALAVVPTLATWRDDLLEGRRRLRLFIVIASATYTALTAYANLTGEISPVSGPNLVAAPALVAIVAPIAWSTLGLRASQGLFATLARPAVPQSLPAEPAPPPSLRPRVSRLGSASCAVCCRCSPCRSCWEAANASTGPSAWRRASPATSSARPPSSPRSIRRRSTAKRSRRPAAR